MPSLVITALVASFTFVRLLKGPWMRNPQYLAAAMIGSMIVVIAGDGLDPGIGDDFIMGNLLALGGSAAGIFLMGRVIA
ncbi:hypothetical protein [Rhizobium halophytocola]|uniref:Uncharacterized protein n=1 Tax=Rhizobium halophytocola TaxID=735519 RepID=A0ABS4DZU2_9HYPH|nr:hypothetical protein [Rhizobium halophytocola]MBP1851211.1 hypothetical protein [Rhizobium halophytocola]